MKKQTKNIRPENTPVLTLKESVGNFSSCSVSFFKDCLGQNQRINNTRSGKAIPAKTIILGVAVMSLKKQIIKPIMPKAQTAMVPLPTPRTRPS